MKLKEARKMAIKHCEENNYNYTYISHDNISEFYLTDNENQHTVFFVNTEQYIIDEIKQSFDKFETDINNYGAVKNIDFTELYSIVENFRQ